MLVGGGVFDYDCDWKLVFIDDQQNLQNIFNHYKAPRQDEADETLRGITLHNFKTIYLMRGHEASWTMLGCTLLWHEMLHAMGFEHEEMPLCKHKPRQEKPNSWTVAIP